MHSGIVLFLEGFGSQNLCCLLLVLELEELLNVRRILVRLYLLGNPVFLLVLLLLLFVQGEVAFDAVLLVGLGLLFLFLKYFLIGLVIFMEFKPD